MRLEALPSHVERWPYVAALCGLIALGAGGLYVCRKRPLPQVTQFDDAEMFFLRHERKTSFVHSRPTCVTATPVYRSHGGRAVDNFDADDLAARIDIELQLRDQMLQLNDPMATAAIECSVLERDYPQLMDRVTRSWGTPAAMTELRALLVSCRGDECQLDGAALSELMLLQGVAMELAITSSPALRAVHVQPSSLLRHRHKARQHEAYSPSGINR